MPRINLLPWREEERKKRQRDFGIAMAAAVVVGVLCVICLLYTSPSPRDS